MVENIYMSPGASRGGKRKTATMRQTQTTRMRRSSHQTAAATETTEELQSSELPREIPTVTETGSDGSNNMDATAADVNELSKL
ncbi:unnamed protein product [Linum tenue]|uniref:Uncharacterized protein n=1 Tax=Linum tenue TaxID=586396 RepID=A0AAV0NRL8_9ROSI|nr:unnamed protein product [Linum tenue]